MADLDYKELWKETLIQLRNHLGEEEFSGWFSDVNYLRAAENSIFLGIPSAFHRDKVKSRYKGLINSIVTQVFGREIAVEFEVNNGKTAKTEPAEALSKPVEGMPELAEGIPEPVEGMSKAKAAQPEIKSEKSSFFERAEEPKPKKKRDKHSQLRDDFTFEKYIIGENNVFAANAAIAISKNPGKAYNPFLIFGGVGLGKTHLMQAIGNFVHENSDSKVIYITSENFLNEYVQAIQEGKMNQFKNRFRYTDVLLIDDIQFFQNRDRVQEELFHTFNALFDAKKQLVFTCDRPVTELKKLDDRLRSRFDLSLKVDLQPPRYEERCAILRSIAETLVGRNISSNVRDLISALTKLIAYTELMGKPVTLEIAQQNLKSAFYTPRQANLSIDIIIRVTAEYFSLTPNDLKGKKRSQNIVFPRQIAMYIGREMTDYSTTELGQDFGGRDHTTVMYSIDRIKGKLLTDPTLESTISVIKQNIKEFSAKQ